MSMTTSHPRQHHHPELAHAQIGDHMERPQPLRGIPGMRNLLLALPATLLSLLAILLVLSLSACSNSGSCVGSGGDVLLSPVCKNDWTRAECREWDEMEVNSANWDFSQRTCERQGFTDRCSDGSFRLPGDC